MIRFRRLQSIIYIVLIMCFTGCTTNPYSAPYDVGAPPANTIKLADGLAYKVLKSGSGNQHPTLVSTITVNYTGWTTMAENLTALSIPMAAPTRQHFR
ncbi:MAG: hypothetical protein WBR29_08230 [Gammaproteobacteria bacterium]